jgi:hypothetical protein
MKEYDVRVQVLASDLTSTEKLIMLAILLKVDWNTFTGPVAISQIVKMTNTKKRTVQRAVKKLVELKWITRTSKHIERELSTPALTTVLVDNIKGVSCMTLDDTSDTRGMSSMTLGDDTNDTVDSVINDTHTISNNFNSISNNMEEPEPHGNLEVDQKSIEGEDEFWLFPSSIEDPVVRRRTELYIQSHPNLPHSERQRLLFPQLCVPIWSTN